VRDLAGRDASAQRIAAVRDALVDIATHIDFVGEVHDVRVREIEGGEVVNFHCRVDPARSVAEVHERVDDLERRLRQRFPSIKRVIGHAEPTRTA
jgi:divalent metal cation (Fe/Co/Zn/Cd) transporter